MAVLHHRDPVTHEWVPILTVQRPGLTGDPGPTQISTDAGNAIILGNDGLAYMAGGGAIDHGTLTGLADDDHPQYYNTTRGDAAHPLRGQTATTITDWNSATENGITYVANGAANAPYASGWFFGKVYSASTTNKKQIVYGFASSIEYPPETEFTRNLENGTWGSWYRTNNFRDSVGTLSNQTYFCHGPAGGTARFVTGMGKDGASTGPTDLDYFRIGSYSEAGAWVRSALTINNNDKIVNMPYTLQAGSTTISAVANTATSKAITFPTAFLKTPRVFVSAATTMPGTQVKLSSATSVTTTGFTGWVYRTATVATTFYWVAIAQ